MCTGSRKDQEECDLFQSELSLGDAHNVRGHVPDASIFSLRAGPAAWSVDLCAVCAHDAPGHQRQDSLGTGKASRNVCGLLHHDLLPHQVCMRMCLIQSCGLMLGGLEALPGQDHRGMQRSYATQVVMSRTGFGSDILQPFCH